MRFVHTHCCEVTKARDGYSNLETKKSKLNARMDPLEVCMKQGGENVVVS